MENTIMLFASSRRHGNTGGLADLIAGELGVEIIDLGEKRVSPYDYAHRNRGDDFEPLIRRLVDFDNIILASPVYWYGVCPVMKSFLDRVSDLLDLPDLLAYGRQLRGKTGYVVCTSIRDRPPVCFIDALRRTFEYLGMEYGGHVHANCKDGFSREKYEKEIVKSDNIFDI